MAMPQQDDYIEQIHRLEGNRTTLATAYAAVCDRWISLRGFATLGDANTPSEARAELMAYAEQQKDWDEPERLKERLKKLLEQMA